IARKTVSWHMSSTSWREDVKRRKNRFRSDSFCWNTPAIPDALRSNLSFLVLLCIKLSVKSSMSTESTALIVSAFTTTIYHTLYHTLYHTFHPLHYSKTTNSSIKFRVLAAAPEELKILSRVSLYIVPFGANTLYRRTLLN